MIKNFIKRHSHNLLFKWIGGLGLSVYRLYENRNHRIHSNGERTLLKKLGKLNPQVIIDGGANVGQYAREALLHCPTARVFCLEPVPETFRLLKENLHGEKRVTFINKGLYHTPGPQKIHLYPSHTHASIVSLTGVPYATTGTTTIHMTRGDDLVNEYGIKKIDLLKLDLEGAEYDALLGFDKTLQAGKIRVVQFEYGYINILTKKLLFDFYQFFAQHGYRVGKIFPKKVEFRPYRFKHEDFLGPNYVAVHEDDHEMMTLLSKR